MGLGAVVRWNKRPGGTAAQEPLTRINAAYSKTPGDISFKEIRQWLGSGGSSEVRGFFENYPPHSLLSATSKALLYYLVRSLHAKTVIEIGTYYAGSTEIIARALWENGAGTVHTLDPYGESLCPKVIAGWPKALQQHVHFYPQNSMAFFEAFANKGESADLVFIDGNHDYEYACFDLAAAARALRPGGMIILNNINQPGPFRAMADFMGQYPQWQELGGSLAGFRADHPFETQRSMIDGTDVAILRAPESYFVGSVVSTTGQRAYAHPRISGIRLSLAAPAPAGTLHVQAILRGFALGHAPEECISHTTAALGGETGDVNVPLEWPLSVTAATPLLSREYKVEIVLFWQPADGCNPLKLSAPPAPIPEITS